MINQRKPIHSFSGDRSTNSPSGLQRLITTYLGSLLNVKLHYDDNVFTWKAEAPDENWPSQHHQKTFVLLKTDCTCLVILFDKARGFTHNHSHIASSHHKREINHILPESLLYDDIRDALSLHHVITQFREQPKQPHETLYSTKQRMSSQEASDIMTYNLKITEALGKTLGVDLSEKPKQPMINRATIRFNNKSWSRVNHNKKFRVILADQTTHDLYFDMSFGFVTQNEHEALRIHKIKKRKCLITTKLPFSLEECFYATICPLPQSIDPSQSIIEPTTTPRKSVYPGVQTFFQQSASLSQPSHAPRPAPSQSQDGDGLLFR